MRRVARSAAAGSSRARSGWCSRASFRHAALIVDWAACRGTPRTSCGSRFATARVYRSTLPPPIDHHGRDDQPPPRNHRRAHGRADRRVAIRAGVPGSRRVPAPPRAGVRPGRPRARFRGGPHPVGRASSCRRGGSRLAVASRARRSLLVHGWESARDRTLPNVPVLHACGFHVLTIEVRGHGVNPPEELPLTAGEFGADATAGAALPPRAPGRHEGRRSWATRWAASGRCWPPPRSRASRRSSPRPRPPTRTGSRARRSASPACRSPARSPIRSPGSRPTSSSSPAATPSDRCPRPARSRRTAGPVLLIHGDAGPGRAVQPPVAARARRRQGPRRRPGRRSGRGARHPGRPAQLAVRVRRPTAAPSPGSSTEALGGPLDPDAARGRRPRDAGVAAAPARAPVLGDRGGARRLPVARPGGPPGRARSRTET